MHFGLKIGKNSAKSTFWVFSCTQQTEFGNMLIYLKTFQEKFILANRNIYSGWNGFLKLALFSDFISHFIYVLYDSCSFFDIIITLCPIIWIFATKHMCVLLYYTSCSFSKKNSWGMFSREF